MPDKEYQLRDKYLCCECCAAQVLTEDQVNILFALVYEGKGAAAIARERGTSESTVRNMAMNLRKRISAAPAYFRELFQEPFIIEKLFRNEQELAAIKQAALK